MFLCWYLGWFRSVVDFCGVVILWSLTETDFQHSLQIDVFGATSIFSQPNRLHVSEADPRPAIQSNDVDCEAGGVSWLRLFTHFQLQS